ncbi:phosphopantetheine-binding protein [Micromonospora sp. NPDC007271]|uniref:phosphopantetheine-binding protein n=1 Tax=Micromonospora sp. NPDC007271 TaxID=3154587 RepID=UPI0033C137D2
MAVVRCAGGAAAGRAGSPVRGVDSLLAVRALARLARDGLAGATVRDFLAAPTVAGLAAARPTPTQ